MSLLMDALKRAEASKQEAARNLGAKTAPLPVGEGLSLTPLADDTTKPAQTPLPDLSSHLAAVDAELASSAKQEASSQPPPPRAPAPPPAATAPSLEERRDIARNAFAAKQETPKANKGLLWLALGTLGVAGIAIGGYVWYQLNTLNGSIQAPPVQRPQPPMASAQPLPPLPPATPHSSSPEPTPTNTDQTRLFAPPPPQPRAVLASPSQTSRQPPEAPIRLTRTRPEPDGNLLQGHAAMQHNELAQARQSFEKVLQRDPNNTDALLALAAIAQAQGHPGEAEQFNQRALIANPSDPAVQGAVLSGTAAGADPQNTESRLKTLLSAQPESAPLNFALGNLYSRQQRWPEAQQAYFNAVAADASNPDYLFNLAVSLDHMRQSRPAAQHYRLALEAAERRPAAFDRPQVRRRLAELQPERQP